MQLDNTDQLFRVAHSLPLALYPVEERISSALGIASHSIQRRQTLILCYFSSGKTKTEISKQPIQIRWARTSDEKERGARSKSGFYKRFGEKAGKPANSALPGYQPDDTRRIRSHREEVAQLDADMDRFLNEDDVQTESLKQRIGGRRGIDPEERRRQLDDELDRFLAGEEVNVDAETEGKSDRPPTLLERTGRRRSASPRRNSSQRQPARRQRREPREENRVKTDSNGRWLHNAEIAASRRRMKYSSDVKGMRAWNDDDVDDTTFDRPVKKYRKTIADLDRELEEL